MIQKPLTLLLIILCFSCGSNDDSTSAAVNLKVSECFDKFNNEVRICLDSVFNDSRCPTGLVCVWGGDATAAFTLTKNQNVRRFNLHTHSGFQNDTIIDGITVRLINIAPYPNA